MSDLRHLLSKLSTAKSPPEKSQSTKKNRPKKNRPRKKEPEWLSQERVVLEDPKRHDGREWDKLSIGRAKLSQQLSDFIEERRTEALKDPLRVTVNSSKPPILVIECSGRILSPTQVDDIIEDEIMKKHVRDTAGFFEDTWRVVLDLRAVRDVYRYAFECNAHRWASYLNVRARRVVVVLPEGRTEDLLLTMAKDIRLSSMVRDIEIHFVRRSREVGQFI